MAQKRGREECIPDSGGIEVEEGGVDLMDEWNRVARMRGGSSLRKILADGIRYERVSERVSEHVPRRVMGSTTGRVKGSEEWISRKPHRQGRAGSSTGRRAFLRALSSSGGAEVRRSDAQVLRREGSHDQGDAIHFDRIRVPSDVFDHSCLLMSQPENEGCRSG